MDISEIREGLIVRPGDTLVLRIKELVSEREALDMREKITQLLGDDARFLICAFDGELAVMQAAEPTTEETTT